MEGRLLQLANTALEKQRRRNRREEQRRKEEVFALNPEIESLTRKMRRVMVGLADVVLGGGSRTAEEIAAENKALRDRRAVLLRAMGKSEDYLDEIFSCPMCGDTGWLDDGSACRCLLAAYKAEQTKELSPLLKAGDECFENFRLDYYSTEAELGGIAPQQQMAQVFDVCHRYAERFVPGGKNLLFTGAPGLGKTFLSAAIARTVADKGFSVAYDTVTGLLAAFEQEKFSADDGEKALAASRVRQLQDCDLLVIDDLGTELTTAFTVSALYTLIDGRLRRKKSTIVSTNLTPAELEERYTQQLASRLLGEYLTLFFMGSDIRRQGKG